MTTTMPSRIAANISGDISGSQVAIGENITLQNNYNGAVIYQGTAPAPTPCPRPVRNLSGRRPAPPLGRDRETQTALTALAGGTCVELTGPAGIGKTTLIKHLAFQAPAEAAADGVVYYEVHGQDVDDVRQTLWETFWDSAVPRKATEKQLRDGLAGVRALVGLDDVSGGRGAVDKVLDTMPAATFLFGSDQQCLWGSGTSTRLRGLDADAGVALFERALGRPVDADDRDAAEAIVDAVDGSPLELMQAAALVSELGFELPALCGRLTKGAAPEELARLLHDSLDDAQRDVLELLGSLDGATLPASELADLVGVDDATPIVEALLKLGLIQAHSPRYSVTSPSTSTSTRPATLGRLIGWAEANQRRPEAIVAETGAVLATLRAAAQDQAWADLLRLGRAVDPAFMVGRRWGAWREVLELELTAARRTGDRAAEGWARHQLGTRAFGLDNRDVARAQLTDALAIREALGDEEGAAVTRHNLGWLVGGGKPAAKPPVPPLPPVPPVFPAAKGAAPLLPKALAVIIGVATLVTGAVVTTTNHKPDDDTVVTPGGETTSTTLGGGGGGASPFTVEPASLAFGDQPVGVASAAQSMRVVNGGAARASVGAVTLAGAGAASYRVNGDCAGTVLAPGAACTVGVSFAPVAVGRQAAAVTVASEGRDPATVPLTGNGAGASTAGAIRLTPPSIDFGRAALGTPTGAQRVTVTASADTGLASVALRGDNAADFALVNRCGSRLAAGAQCTVDVRFTPSADGPRLATLAVTPAGAAEAASTVLTGVGGSRLPPVTPGGRVDIQTPPDQTVAYGSAVTLRVTSRGPSPVRLSATVPVAGLSFVDGGDGTGAITGTVAAAPSPTPVTVTVTGQAGDEAPVSRTFAITVVPADIAIRWAQSLLDLRVGPAIAKAVVSQPGGTTGDLTKAQLQFEFTNVLSGAKSTFGPLPVDAGGAASITLLPGQLPLGAYTARARLVTPNDFFRLAAGTSPPTAVVVNTDALGATVYTLSDLLNLISP